MNDVASTQLSQLRVDCEIAAKLWGRTFSALGAMTYREKGEPAIHRLWQLLLSTHQDTHYREGLRKLGIGDDEPPAVIAAKYHYFTNIIGGLPMEYAEESPKKVWIRYRAPMWTYAGVAMIAMPAALRRTAFSIWQPRDGELIGCRRLGWVATKFIMEGDPYDEGYFIEHDRDLAPHEYLKYEVAHVTPECDWNNVPKLDPEQWPEARILKARRNWSRGYARTTTEQLQVMFGEVAANYIVHQAMRCLAIQYIHEFKRDLRIETDDVASVAQLLVRILKACDQDFTAEQVNSRKHRITLRSFKPFDNDASEGIRAAFFQFQHMGARVLNGRLAVTRHREMVAGARDHEVWEIEDTGRWLW